ncbi:MAG: hypothetical protein IJ714_08945 [Bacteroidales bacterium]|nr:hypothetical protein [Bacteroidales bacterium]
MVCPLNLGWCDAIRTDGYGGQGWDFDSQWAFTDATARSLGRSIRPLQR